MRGLVLMLLLAGCGAQLLPTTLFHTTLPEGTEPSAADWSRLMTTRGTASDVVALSALGPDEWITWTARERGSGTLVRSRRTSLGLEAQAIGSHDGPHVRPSIRVLIVSGTRIVIVESSASESSTERDAWLYVEHAGEILPLTLDGASAQLRVRAEQQTALERGWTRAATLTATFESIEDRLVVHEHESVRELAEDRPELPARSTYEVERARTLRRHEQNLVSDRSSLFAARD